MKTQDLVDKLRNKTELRIALISDTHFAIYKSDNIFFHHMVDTITNFIEECENRKVDLVIHTGDVSDTKDLISTEGLFKTNEQVFRIAERFPIIIIPGNHDYSYAENNQVNFPSNYKEHNNILVIDSYQGINFKSANTVLHFLPYYKNPIPEINNIVIDNNKYNYFFGHLGIYGFKVHEYATNYVNEISSQITMDYFKKFTHSFLGHYHGYQSHDNITYVSAPLQSRHGDENSKHGFVFFNTDDQGEHKFIENTKTPQFKTIELTKESAKEILKINNKYLRVVIKKKLNKELIIALRRKLQQSNYDVKLDIDIQDTQKLAVISGWKEFVLKDPDHLIIKYFEFLEQQNQLPFDKNALLQLLEIEKEK